MEDDEYIYELKFQAWLEEEAEFYATYELDPRP